MDHLAPSDAQGDAVDELLDRIGEKVRLVGGNGSGNGSGNGGGDSGGSGGEPDPFDAPVNVRMLIDAARVIAEAMVKVGGMNLQATEMLSDRTVEVIRATRDAGQENLIETAKQLHADHMGLSAMTTRLASALNDRFEALERRVLAIERRPVPPVSGDDAGGGP